MADIKKLRDLLEAYGSGVRAGVITPCLQDENAFREMLGLQSAPQDVVSAWAAQGGIRAPITLQRPNMITDVPVDENGNTIDENGGESNDR
jgi:hypothetical protein